MSATSQSSRTLLQRVRARAFDELLQLSFIVMQRLLPTRKSRWTFATWPGAYGHTLDNPRAVFEVVKNDPSVEKVILRRDSCDPNTTTPEGKNLRFVRAESLEGAYCLATSRVVLTGFALTGLTSYSRHLTRKQRIVQLWHGIPLKRIGKLFAGETHWDAETWKYAATVSSSPRDQELMSAAFAPLPLENTWLSGLPRNSTILKPEVELAADYQSALATLRTRTRGRRMVLYAPTWREGSAGIFEFTDGQLTALRALLAEQDAVLGIRAHANRRMTDDSSGDDRIFFANDFPDVNVILRETAVLITDYSSIYIDFLITGRPILHFTYDIDHYVSERGFLYPLEEAFASPHFQSFDDLLVSLRGALSGGVSDAPRYKRATALFHTHEDDTAADVAARIRALASSK